MEGFAVTCPLAPDVPRLLSGFCSSPRSFGFSFLQTPPHDDALAVPLALGSPKTWLPDCHRHSYVPCPVHTTARLQPRTAREAGSPLSGQLSPLVNHCNGLEEAKRVRIETLFGRKESLGYPEDDATA